MIFIRKDGTSEKFHPDTLFNVAARDIVARAAAHGVHVVDVEEQARHAREADRQKLAEDFLRQLAKVKSHRTPTTPDARRTTSPAPTPAAADTTGRVVRIVAGTLGLEPEAVSPEKTLAQLNVEFPEFPNSRRNSRTSSGSSSTRTN